MRGAVVPADVDLAVTRNYGETAAEKSNELLLHMLIAIVSVTLLMWPHARRAASPASSRSRFPVTLALTLSIFYLFGYTLNRVTLFALIFSIGILVDDAIVVVENIVRHFRLPENHDRPLRDIAVEAVDEVGNPTILATFAVIAAILPMGFVRGLMGPYMRPIPVGASAAMLFSLLVAFVVTPWASLRLLKRDASHGHAGEGRATKLFRRIDGGPARRREEAHPLSRRRRGPARRSPLGLFALKLVRVKMLPFDNKSEFQVIVDMPEGTTLERTAAVAQEIASVVGERARGRELSGLRRHGRALQLQRAGAALLPPPRAERRGRAGQPAAERGPRRAEPRHREAGSRRSCSRSPSGRARA